MTPDSMKRDKYDKYGTGLPLYPATGRANPTGTRGDGQRRDGERWAHSCTHLSQNHPATHHVDHTSRTLPYPPLASSSAVGQGILGMGWLLELTAVPPMRSQKEESMVCSSTGVKKQAYTGMKC